MSRSNSISKTVGRATLVGVLLILAACGGGGKGKEADCKEPEHMLESLVCGLSGAWGKPTGSGAPISGGSAKLSGGSASVDSSRFESAEIAHYVEFEPNSSLDNANVVTLAQGSPEVSSGVEIEGTMQGAYDSADHYIFTPVRSRAYTVYLCDETCADTLQDDSVYVMIHDQNQTTITSTPVGASFEQVITAELIAGLAYYVQIQAYNTGGDIYDYRLVIVN